MLTNETAWLSEFKHAVVDHKRSKSFAQILKPMHGIQIKEFHKLFPSVNKLNGFLFSSRTGDELCETFEYLAFIYTVFFLIFQILNFVAVHRKFASSKWKPFNHSEKSSKNVWRL